jgi:hypothetical protein
LCNTIRRFPTFTPIVPEESEPQWMPLIVAVWPPEIEIGPLVNVAGKPLCGSDDNVNWKVVSGPVWPMPTLPLWATDSWSEPRPEDVVMEASTGPVPV